MLSLSRTPASTASLLLNFEGVATMLIALFFFREAISRRALGAVLAITLASIFLSTKLAGGFTFSLGALGVLAACTLWGIDNNFTRNISAKDPLTIVAAKGLISGLFSLALGLSLGERLPGWTRIASILLLGWISYGLSTRFFIYAMRGLGAARTSALYGTAPLAGVLLSFLIFKDEITLTFGIAAVLMVAGAWLLANEEHAHFHIHMPEAHEHAHSSTDEFHNHEDQAMTAAVSHSHEHEHPRVEHEHGHMPDIHHRHGHEDEDQ
jgi:drug/metabolite transporter (DMT)-like permease